MDNNSKPQPPLLFVTIDSSLLCTIIITVYYTAVENNIYVKFLK
jgi:hypothetical protein